MGTYGQFCPVAKAMELLDERWTMLVVRELLCGSRHFNELRRGVPRMSPALLSKRLQTLVRAGVVERREDGNRVEYLLTPAGEELRSVVEALGVWGTRWVPQLGDEHLDPHLLLWDVHRNLDLEAMPDARTVLAFHIRDARQGARDWWVVAADGEVDLCHTDPGHEVTARIEASLEALTRVWLGELDWERAVGAGWVTVHAPATVRRQLPSWLKLSGFAAVPRPASAAAGGH
ncbi:MAG TPA: helix-turn-helix domain-containing protein [Egibacteraceae bacterium]|nr:helix-turn-helix domain-containing protein [Egibacteraceae bacterium]